MENALAITAIAVGVLAITTCMLNMWALNSAKETIYDVIDKYEEEKQRAQKKLDTIVNVLKD